MAANDQAQPTKPPLISLKGVNKSFSTKGGQVSILHDINFTVAENSLAIIFGPSGSGKTTLLNVLSGLEPPTTGRVEIANQDLFELEADQRSHFRAQNMGIVHQANYWVKSLNVLENVAMPLYLSGSDKPAALSAARSSLEKVGMSEYIDYQPTVLSGGQQQRVSMARALVASPKLILADEPTGNNIEYLPLSDTQLYILDGKLTEARRGQKMPPDILNSLKTQINELTDMEHDV